MVQFFGVTLPPRPASSQALKARQAEEEKASKEVERAAKEAARAAEAAEKARIKAEKDAEVRRHQTTTHTLARNLAAHAVCCIDSIVD